MKTAQELSKISDEFVGKFVDVMKQYQHDAISEALDNLSDNDKMSRCIKVKYLFPRVDGSQMDYKVDPRIAVYIDVRTTQRSEITELIDTIQEELNALGYKTSMQRDVDLSPYMSISW